MRAASHRSVGVASPVERKYFPSWPGAWTLRLAEASVAYAASSVPMIHPSNYRVTSVFQTPPARPGVTGRLRWPDTAAEASFSSR